MTDQKKIILMTKLALYEKNDKRKDKPCTDYYVEDYIYMSNLKTRLGITFITVFFAALGALEVFNEAFVFPTSLGEVIEVYVSPYFWPWVFALVGYTVISTFAAGRRHKEAMTRFNKYKKLLRQLRNYEAEREMSEGAPDEL